ncbi:uncharacterized protein SRS1_14286 [Sporisorium reilianum f. sp. reilianum]|uniref:Chromo domain-containing protein n=1 Tax=Sporisorium reilianum f. sp. reilianum TaxID=72559 RepID=A0A2N8UFK9_9BASI|nr:uncharacterized protein SRS1_14286 [Sporisorium reilianum f. sp. reilianum]
MPATPRGRSRTASTSASPSKSNGRKQPARIALDISDDDDEQIVEKKPAKRGRPPKAAKKDVQTVEDDDEEDEEDEDEDDDDSVQAEDEYEVEAIRTHRPLKGAESWNMEYRIKWKGYDEADNTWEPETNLPRNMVDAYWKTQPSKSQPKKFEQVQKRKPRHDDDDLDEIEVVDDEEAEEEPHGKPASRGKNGRRASAPSSKNGSPAKKPRMSTSSRRRASPEEEEDEEDDEEEDSDDDGDARSKPKDENKQRAMDKVRSRFLDHYMSREDWEDCVDCIINMQRSEDDSRLQSWVQFEQSNSWTRAMKSIEMPEEANGRGPRLWVDNDIANERCPQKVIKFYQQHVRFSNPRLAR